MSREVSPADQPPRLVGLAPVVGARTRLVVLGSFPGAASLAAGQYYAHPRNQFWPIVSQLLGVDLTQRPYAERLEVLLAQGLGLWDVYGACRRVGSLDTAIRDAEPNDLHVLLRAAPRLAALAHNGSESARSATLSAALGARVYRLPSTSPANARWSLERKVAAWRVAFEACGLVGAAAASGTVRSRTTPP